MCLALHPPWASRGALRAQGSSGLCSGVIHRLWPEGRVQAGSCCSPGPLESGVPHSPSSSAPKQEPGLASQKSARQPAALLRRQTRLGSESQRKNRVPSLFTTSWHTSMPSFLYPTAGLGSPGQRDGLRGDHPGTPREIPGWEHSPGIVPGLGRDEGLQPQLLGEKLFPGFLSCHGKQS